MIDDPRGPRPEGWLTRKRQAILFILATATASFLCGSGFMLFFLANKNREPKMDSSLSKFEEKKKKPLKDGVSYDWGLEQSNIHLGGEDEFKMPSGRVFLYIRTDQPMSAASRKIIEAELLKISYINKKTFRVDPHGVAVERLSSHYDASLDPDEALIEWTRVLTRVKNILIQNAQFEVQP